MSDEIQLISDGDGLAVIGEPSAVERFLTTEQLSSTDLGLPRLRSVLGFAAGLADGGSAIAASSGRWVQLTQESAQLAQKYALVHKSATGLSTGVLRGENGRFVGLLEFANAPGSLVANLASPAVLAGAAGIMAQLAMQMAMDEITDYLAVIDEKVDEILRGQKDAVFADMIGVDFVIEEAMTIREQVGRVSEVTWSKIQGTSVTIARTQAYVLRRLDALAVKLERENDIGDLARTSKEAVPEVQEWLAVLAHCFKLQDAISILEIDRVLDAASGDLNQHRLGLRAARRNRLNLIARSTEHLMARMDAAAGVANKGVLLHPISSRSVVNSSNHVAAGVIEFHARLGIERDRKSLEATRWIDAAEEMKDRVIETGADGVGAAARFGGETFIRARSMTDDLSSRIAERARRLRPGAQDPSDGPDPEG